MKRTNNIFHNKCVVTLLDTTTTKKKIFFLDKIDYFGWLCNVWISQREISSRARIECARSTSSGTTSWASYCWIIYLFFFLIVLSVVGSVGALTKKSSYHIFVVVNKKFHHTRPKKRKRPYFFIIIIIECFVRPENFMFFRFFSHKICLDFWVKILSNLILNWNQNFHHLNH